jgi:hypothetical protein
MSADDDSRARREAWIAAGAPDYGAPTYDGSGNITGYESVADQPASQRSEPNMNVERKEDGTVYESGIPWFSPGGGAFATNEPFSPFASATNNPNPIQMAQQSAARAASGVGTNNAQSEADAQLQALVSNPKAAMAAIIQQMGYDPYSNNEMSNYLRKKSGLLDVALMLMNQGDMTTRPTRDSYLQFMAQLFGGGGNLPDKSGKQMMAEALGLGGTPQNAGWKEMLTGATTEGPNVTSPELQYIVQALSAIANMGNINPFNQMLQSKLGDSLGRYTQQYGTGQLGGSPSFMGWLQQHPELFGY